MTLREALATGAKEIRRAAWDSDPYYDGEKIINLGGNYYRASWWRLMTKRHVDLADSKYNDWYPVSVINFHCMVP